MFQVKVVRVGGCCAAVTSFLRCDTLSKACHCFKEKYLGGGGGGGSKAVSWTPTMAPTVGGSPQTSSEDGARMLEEWPKKEKGRKTQHFKHNREQAVLW